MRNSLKNRISRIRKRFDSGQNGYSLLVSSAPEIVSTRDQFFPYRQNSDFFYLTGSEEPGQSLLISSELKKPVLFAPKPDPHKILWDGAPSNPKKTAAEIGAELIVSDKADKEIKERLKGTHALYFQNVPGSTSWKVASSLMEIPSHLRGKYPSLFEHSDGVLEEMRLYKDKHEVALIRRAADITTEGIMQSLSHIHPGSSENLVAATIEYWYRLLGGVPGFSTIAAAGPSAATLHYRSLSRKLKKGELILIDTGAAYKMYNADITRVFPVDGKFTDLQGDHYAIVLEAQKAALSKIRHGARIDTVMNAACHVITQGLVYLKVLRGKVSTLYNKKAYLPYFPHGIGHSLGIDVHDVGKLRGSSDAVLKEGMVLTVEPGLYFQKPIRKIPVSGVRIEDNVLVTKRGYVNLTDRIAKEEDEIESLMRSD